MTTTLTGLSDDLEARCVDDQLRYGSFIDGFPAVVMPDKTVAVGK